MQEIKNETYKRLNLTSSLVDLSCRWPGEEVKRSGKTELGREPGDESDLWKSPPPPLLERSPPSRFCKAAIFDLVEEDNGTNAHIYVYMKRRDGKYEKELGTIRTWISLSFSFAFGSIHRSPAEPRSRLTQQKTWKNWYCKWLYFGSSMTFRSRYGDNRRDIMSRLRENYR